MSEKLEFEDRSGRTIPARLVLMIDIDMKAEGMPEPGELSELMKQVDGMVQSMKNAQGRNWHVDRVTTNSFPPANIGESFSMLQRMYQMIGVMAVWAGTMSKIHLPLGEMIKPARMLSQVSGWLSEHIKEIATARSQNEQIRAHCEGCADCKAFFDKFEGDAAEWSDSKEEVDLDDAMELLEQSMDEGERKGCN